MLSLRGKKLEFIIYFLFKQPHTLSQVCYLLKPKLLWPFFWAHSPISLWHVSSFKNKNLSAFNYKPCHLPLNISVCKRPVFD